ncbi:amino acid ABC transporter permease [Rhizobium sp. YJ-22]|uniref:amino acid ABC transporter permease n=1 Tax=Rhizobium sp. YJ-22 TaxID=3037556 RepID=UPI000A4BD177|nr:amino acid ABC transporter permease [Rhizobium sp. YJ-22]MBN9030592.1 amino acid ABC transporter permease [Hyphomicrobiales bacterium]MDG3578481.1 amino acid ABC transporter permease [Rhizobium sp. YJ-22]
MAMMQDKLADSRAPAVSPLYDPRIRGLFYQIVTVLALVGIVFVIVTNTADNLRRANISSGFGFLQGRAGFDLGQSLIEYSSDHTYLRALEVGFINTLLVAVVGIALATAVGLVIGIGRLSSNWLIARLCTVYVELFRNIPPLLVIFFWYVTVINILPQVRASIALPLDIFINNRGVYFPKPIFGEGFDFVAIAFVVGIVLSIMHARWVSARQMATGKRAPVLPVVLALIVGLPLVVYFIQGMPLTFDVPTAGKFNLTGGSNIGPEFVSLLLALSLYTAAFIAEIVRAGIRGVPKGQSEAANALGVRPGLAMRLIVIPQALRIIIPPLTSQYLNLIKNSSLAVAIGYADLVAVGGTILNQTGHSIEIVAIWMVFYVTVSLLTSLFMNWFNAKMALVER